jgi:hypothetical protein
MDYFLIIVEIVSGVSILIGSLSAFFVWMRKLGERQDKLVEGQKCQLRSDMLRTYYKHIDDNIIRQYEYENFMLMYKAYKELKGNSFIDKIHDEVEKWKVEP